MSDDPRHSLGRLGERLAAEHLERLGYRVVARNYRTRFGELDLVVTDEEVLVFCEVKTRRAARWADAEVARALRDGWTWAQVAEALGVTRQAVHKKHARRLRGV